MKIKKYELPFNDNHDYFLYTINDLFILDFHRFEVNFYGYLDLNFYEKLSYFPTHLHFIEEVSNRVGRFLNMDKIIIELNDIYMKGVNLNYVLFAFFSGRSIPIFQIEDDRKDFYEALMAWHFSPKYSLIFDKKYNLLHGKDIEYTENTNNLLILNEGWNAIRTYDMEKNMEELIDFTVLLFNLKRKDMKYAIQ